MLEETFYTFQRMKSIIKKLRSIIHECIICFREGIHPRFFALAILKKFFRYINIFPSMKLLNIKNIDFLPTYFRKIVPLLPDYHDIVDLYDIFTSFFFFQDFIPETGWLVIDAGAFKGFYTEICAQLVEYKGKVYAIEPNSILCANLRKRFEKTNYLNTNITEVALGDHEGNIKLYVSVNFPSTSSIYDIHTLKFDANSKPVEVELSTIDIIVEKEKIKKIDLVKIDVEGAEINVLLGAEKSMKNGLIKRFVIEIHEDLIALRKVTKLLSIYGYKIKLVLNTSTMIRPYVYAKHNLDI